MLIVTGSIATTILKKKKYAIHPFNAMIPSGILRNTWVYYICFTLYFKKKRTCFIHILSRKWKVLSCCALTQTGETQWHCCRRKPSGPLTLHNCADVVVENLHQLLSPSVHVHGHAELLRHCCKSWNTYAAGSLSCSEAQAEPEESCAWEERASACKNWVEFLRDPCSWSGIRHVVSSACAYYFGSQGRAPGICLPNSQLVDWGLTGKRTFQGDENRGDSKHFWRGCGVWGIQWWSSGKKTRAWSSRHGACTSSTGAHD